MVLDLFYKTGGFAMMPEDLPEETGLPPAFLN